MKKKKNSIIAMAVFSVSVLIILLFLIGVKSAVGVAVFTILVVFVMFMTGSLDSSSGSASSIGKAIAVAFCTITSFGVVAAAEALGFDVRSTLLVTSVILFIVVINIGV